MNKELQNQIDELAQSRIVEKIFDNFVEDVTEQMLEMLALPALKEDEAGELMDYILEKVMGRFNYKLVKEEQK